MKPTHQHLAILAGAGELPLIAAQNARSQNIPFTLYHITEADLNAELAADLSLRKREVSLGSVGKTFAYLKEDQITAAILLGKIEKQRLLQDVQRDAEADKIYAAAKDRRDDTLFHEFARALAAMQIEILPQKALLDGCFLPPGILTQKKPESSSLLEDIEFGYELSKKVGSLDIGQTAVVFQKMVLAVEAIEGTDAAIMRAGAIIRSKGSHADAPPVSPRVITSMWPETVRTSCPRDPNQTPPCALEASSAKQARRRKIRDLIYPLLAYARSKRCTQRACRRS